ncbi:MAG: arsenate reductase ArsC [Bdellovibrionota bacterium]
MVKLTGLEMPTDTENKKVLFLCTGNSCRSQMAEGWCHHLHKDITAHSAGIVAHGINLNAVQVMREIGIDISRQASKTLEEIRHIKFDLVVTVCNNAAESCPIFPGAKVIHHSFDDPPTIAKDLKSEPALAIYSRVRDEIGTFVKGLHQYF